MRAVMRAILINTGTELLLGEVLNTHLRFLAREIFQFGLRVEEQRTVPDSPTLQETLAEIFPRAEIVFVTGVSVQRAMTLPVSWSLSF